MSFIKDYNTELQEMLKNAVHFGHYTKKWNPKMKPFIYGIKDGVHVFDLHQTIAQLDTALDYLAKCSKEGKTILLVSTKQQSTPILEKVAEETGMPYVTNKWIPGFITNFTTVHKRIVQLKKWKDMIQDGGLDKYTKKEALKIQKNANKLQQVLGGVEGMEKRPDVLFVVDTVRDAVAVREANKVGIPVIAIVDSNSDPDKVDFAIPGNDDAIKSLTYLMGKVSEAIGPKGSKGSKK